MRFKNIRVYNFENALRGMRNPLESWDKSDSLYGITTIDKYENMCASKVGKDWEEYFGQDIVDNYYMNDEQYQKFEEISDKVERNTMIYHDKDYVEYAFIGDNDMRLAQRLISAGPEHRKFLRQIFVTVDITAPIYWWKEFSTYKIATTANSTSTMHKLSSNPITLDCFEINDYDEESMPGIPISHEEEIIGAIKVTDTLIEVLETLRQTYLETNDKRYWKELVRWLPMGWLQTRTVTMNYENLLSMVNQRQNHKLNEWSGKDNPDNSNFIDFVYTLPYADEFIFFNNNKQD